MNRPALLLMISLLLLAACGRNQNSNAIVAPADNESADQKVDALKRAFGEARPNEAVPAQLSADVQKLFDAITAAGSANNAEGVLRHLDFEYLLAAAQASGLVTGANDAERRGFVAGFKQSARTTWFDGNNVFDWKRTCVMRVEKVADDRFVLAYARHDFDDEGTNIKARWWLVREGQTWKFFDWEFLNTGIRISRLLGAFADPAKKPAWAGKIQHLQSARLKLDEGDNAGALKDLERAADARMPLDLEAVRLELIGTAEYQAGNFEAALGRFDRVLKLKPDFPDARYMRGSTLFNLERYEEAVPDLKWYVEMLGSDALAMIELADCLTWLDRNDEAIEYYRASLRDTPLVSGVLGLGMCLPADKTAELRSWFLRLPEHDENFTYLADQLYFENYLPAALREICAAYRTVRASSHELAYYSARLLLDDEKPAEAATLLRPALGKVYGEELEDYRAWYWQAMYLSGQGLQAFNEAAGSATRKAAFLYLADEYFNDADAKGLEAICQAWSDVGKRDPALHFYLAEADFFAEDWPAAEKHFREGLPLIKTGEDFYVGIRHGLWDTMRRQGRALDAYAEFRPAADVFAYLERWHFSDEQVDELEKLVAAHITNLPDDPWLYRAAGDIGWLKKDWGMATAGYKSYIKPDRRDEPDYWELVERCIRAALRAGDARSAEETARTAFETRNLWLLIIALVGAGKPAEAVKSIDEFIADEDPVSAAEWMQEFYADEDIGTKLRGTAYADLQKRFPPPPVKEPTPPAGD